VPVLPTGTPELEVDGEQAEGVGASGTLRTLLPWLVVAGLAIAAVAFFVRGGRRP
jgi:hypothetical protein